VKLDCLAFRTLLENQLVGRPDPSSLSALSWHEHLFGCGDCRRLFEGEEALEALLATWPEPRLSPEVKRRVLMALAKSKRFETSLDALLERDVEYTAPKDLAARVLAGLEMDRGAIGARSKQSASAKTPVNAGVSGTFDPLDRLLERAGDVTVPRDLARHVLAALATERAPARRPILAWRRSTWLAAAAAIFVLALVVWLAQQRPETPVEPIVENVPTTNAPQMDGLAPRKIPLAPQVVSNAPDVQMLAALDVLENWDLLMSSDDVDALLSTLGTADEVLLDYQDEG